MALSRGNADVEAAPAIRGEHAAAEVGRILYDESLAITVGKLNKSEMPGRFGYFRTARRIAGHDSMSELRKQVALEQGGIIPHRHACASGEMR